MERMITQLLSSERDISAQDVRGKRVFVRADLNLPMASNNVVADATRLDAALPTLRLLSSKGARIVVASHLGRPEPGVEPETEMRARDSLRPVAELLRQALGDNCFVGMADDCTGPSALAIVASLKDGQVCLLENTRFHPGDAANDPGLARELASLCDVFVLDGFGVSHRAQASVTGVALALPPAARFPGPLVLSELRFIGAAVLSEPKRPLGVVIGGSKVKDKIGVISALIRRANVIVVGGRMAFTFLAARGVAVGQTAIEPTWLEKCREMEAAAHAAGVQLLLPCDALVSHSLDGPVDARIVPLTVGCCSTDAPCVPTGWFGVDVGPQTREEFSRALSACGTILWNGPMGKYEVPAFAEGTLAMVRTVVAATAAGAVTIVAGGDSVAALNATGNSAAVSHVSTGGGASLQLLEGKAMPGLSALLPEQPAPAAAPAAAAAAAVTAAITAALSPSTLTDGALMDPATAAAVARYYGETLSGTADLKTSAFACAAGATAPALRDLLASVPEEVLSKFYGCGAPLPLGMQGKRVLDLGCGSGRDCYVASALVGPTGHVTGVDMLESMLEIARRNAAPWAARLGHPATNMRFVNGKIEDLRSAGIADSSVDVVISNCVVNLSCDKRAVLKEAYRVLADGGEFHFSDMYCDRRLPAAIRADPVLVGEGVGGSMYGADFERLCKEIVRNVYTIDPDLPLAAFICTQGFADPRKYKKRSMDIISPDIAEKVGLAKYFSVTYRLFKLPAGRLEAAQEDFGHVALYKGTIDRSMTSYMFDLGHTFEQGRPVLVSGNTAAMLQETWLAPHFTVRGDRSVHYGSFDEAAQQGAVAGGGGGAAGGSSCGPAPAASGASCGPAKTGSGGASCCA